jgi:hypothetical protein
VCPVGSADLDQVFGALPLYILVYAKTDQEFWHQNISWLLHLYILVAAKLDQEFAAKNMSLLLHPLYFRIR